MTRYPGIAEYNQSAQNPSRAFTDPQLAGGTLATSALGLPVVLGGGFALTYTVTAGARKFAVRCFHRYVPDLEQRYAQISEAISGMASEHFVSFAYQREGVRVKSDLYPVVKMAWAEGSTLGGFIEDNYDDGAAVRALWSAFGDLARFLSERGIAHGDLENGNLVVRPDGGLTLIDYDGMYVPGMALGNGNELGHAHFQHPGRTPDHFGPRIDDFSFILIDLSLDAIARDPALYDRFCNGDNILFQRSDFEDPATSPVFRELRRMAPLADKVDDFAAICRGSVENVPTLAEFVSRHRRPRSSVPAPARQKSAGTSNLDYIRSALGKSAPAPEPVSAKPAARAALTARSVIPPSGPSADPAPNPAYPRNGGWPLWLGVSFGAMLLLMIMYKL